MWQRLMAIALGAVLYSGCGEDSTRVVRPGFDPGFNPAGSCNQPMQGTCDEYAEADATTATSQSCASAGGTWLAGKCPFEARLGLCTAVSGATRTYSYTPAATTGLMSSCPAGKFVMYKPPAAGMGGRAGGGAGGSGGGGTMAVPDAGPDDDAGM